MLHPSVVATVDINNKKSRINFGRGHFAVMLYGNMCGERYKTVTQRV